MDISIAKLDQRPIWTIFLICFVLIGSGFAVMNWYHEKQIIYITSKYETEISGYQEKLRGANNERSRDKPQVAEYEQLDYNTAFKYADTGSRSNLTSKSETDMDFQLTPLDMGISVPEMTSIAGSAEVVDASSGIVFMENDPYPIEHNKVKIGAPVSLLKSIYPSGSLDSTTFTTNFLNGPFSMAIFRHNSEGMDPKITSISFLLKDELADQRVRSEAILAFQKCYRKSSLLGRNILWRILDTELTIEDLSNNTTSLSISKDDSSDTSFYSCPPNWAE